MKLVATRDIYNVGKLNITPDKDQTHSYAVTHPKVILKGTRFTIGSSEKQDELDDASKEKILWLHHSKAAVSASDKAVERIDREVKLDIERLKKESVKPVSMEELIAVAVAKAVAETVGSPKK